MLAPSGMGSAAARRTRRPDWTVPVVAIGSAVDLGVLGDMTLLLRDVGLKAGAD